MNQPTSDQSFSRWVPYLLLIAVVLNATGLCTDILDGDGALYATTAKYMILRNDWINLYALGGDWLDKPHFPFWMAALSYKLLGITPFAYKFAAFLFWLLGLRFTWLLAKALYNVPVAQIAVLMQALALHGMLSNFDVRAEPYLTALCTGAVYYFYRSYTTGKWYYLLLTALLSGCAVMTKGIFILLTIGGGFVLYWIITKQWKQFTHYKWYVLIVLFGICILPEIYCLYVQFDQHPEKEVFGEKGVSGIRFFLWDSQFGRFFNTGPIKGKGDVSFFLHTTLWAFLPWALYLYWAVYRLIIKKTAVTNPARWILFGSSGLTFLLFSFSSFQLPHYIIILFPQFAILTADCLYQVSSATAWKRLNLVQNILLLLAAAMVISLMLFSKIGYSASVFFITAAILAILFILRKQSDFTLFMVKGLSFAAVLFLFLNPFFYPRLMQYQSGMMAGKWLEKRAERRLVGMYRQYDFSLEFYAPQQVVYLRTPAAVDSFTTHHSPLIYTKASIARELQASGKTVHILQSFPYYRVTVLTGKFLHPATRSTVTDTVLLAEVRR